ncbi:Metallo-dependent phosphatase-like protein [Aspergillus karnatakaensis]|uniref:bifunctional metallophosphatase/5'-nucleotidase n=1 Tax=Aspergillus karnatakaensis TaxID=1810916 RepID=UPI003CCE495C
MQSEEIQFVHFNDVYHVPSPELLTGFLSLQREFAASNPKAQTLTIFSGDAFSPSLEASVLQGEQICPLLNLVNVDIGCYGNHDFDFGDARLIELSSLLNFPWLLSNAIHLPVGTKRRLLGSAKEYIVRQLDNGLRVGFIGLAGTDWPSNCDDLPPCEIESPIDVSRRLAYHLRVSERCDVVIALTHMRVPEDMAVANATTNGDNRVDLLLGGHDHEVVRRFAGDTDLFAENVEQGRKITEVEADGMVPDAEGDIRLVKSGTDWRALSLIRLVVQRDENGDVVGSTVKLRQYTDILAAVPPQTPSPAVLEAVQSIHDRVGTLVQKPLLHSAIPIDGRNFTIRREETNMGNMLADAIRAFYETDVGFFNSGGIRSDQILRATLPGGEPLLVRDLINICPFGNGLVVKKLTGKAIRLSLENAVSNKHSDGRFLHLSGLKMVASWQRPEWSRVIDVLFEKPDGTWEALDPDRTYTVAMPSFIAQGYDGFVWFSKTETIVGDEAAMTDIGLLLGIFGHGEESHEGEQEVSPHAMGIERARATIVKGHNPGDSLPIVRPVVEDRIRFVEA